MRKTIASEGVPKPDGRKLKLDALFWRDDEIPITNGLMDNIVGKATDIRREPNGVITADLSIDPGDCEIVLYLNNIVIEPWQSQLVVANQTITKARLRAIVLGPKAPVQPSK